MRSKLEIDHRKIEAAIGAADNLQRLIGGSAR